MGKFKINGELDINSYLTANSTLYISSKANTSIIFRHGEDEYARINPKGCLNIGSSQTSDSYKLYVAGASYLGDTVNAKNIVPITNGSYDIGSSSKVWANEHVRCIYLRDHSNGNNVGGTIYTALSTATTAQPTFVELGNNTASGTSGNRYGILRLYSEGTYYSELRALTGTAHAIHYLPTTGGTLLNSSNFNSYAPKLDGTGATGTWGISVTGNAGTATKLKTARTIALTNEVEGSGSFNGSGNLSISATVKSVAPETIRSGVIENNIYISTHPEDFNKSVVIPFIHNDIANTLLKGGTMTMTINGVAQTQEDKWNNLFDGTCSYCSYDGKLSSKSDVVVIELVLHKKYDYGNRIYVDFGCLNWAPKDVKIEYAGPEETSYHIAVNDTNVENRSRVLSAGISASTTGIKKLRFTFTNWNNSASFRIAALGLLNYNSKGVGETFISQRGSSSVVGNIIPFETKKYDLGSKSILWNGVYASEYGVNNVTDGNYNLNSYGTALTVSHHYFSSSYNKTNYPSNLAAGDRMLLTSYPYSSSLRLQTLFAGDKYFARYESADGTWNTWKQFVSIVANTAVGSVSKPVYIDANGVPQLCTSVNLNASTATEFSSNATVKLTGDVTGEASAKKGWTVSTTLKNSGVTAGSYGPSDNATLSTGSTFSVPYLTVDAKGRVTAASTKTMTMPTIGNATITLSAGKGLTDGGNFTTNTATNKTVTFNVGAGDGISVTDDAVALAEIANFTAGSFGPSEAANPSHGGTFSVPYVTVDKYGRVTAASTQTITLPTYTIGNATITISAGNGLITGGSFTLNASSNKTVTLAVGAGTGISVTADAVSLATVTGLTAGSYGPTSTTAAPTHGGTFNVPYVTVDSYGRVTSIANQAVTLPTYTIGNATITLAAGSGLTDGGDFTTNTAANKTITFNIGAGAGISVTDDAVALAASGVTAGNYGPSDNASPSHGGTFSVPYVTVDTYGRVTAASTKTITLPTYTIGNATITLSAGKGLTDGGNFTTNATSNKTVTFNIGAGTGIVVNDNDVALATSGVTAGSYGPSAAATVGSSGSFSVPYLTVDAYGRVTAASTKTITMESFYNVTQTVRTTNGSFPILLRGTSAGTATTTTTTSFASGVTINPSTNTISATGLALSGDLSVGGNITATGNITVSGSQSCISYGTAPYCSSQTSITATTGLNICQGAVETSGIQLNGDYIVMWSPADSYCIRYYDEDDGSELWNISSAGLFSGTAAKATDATNASKLYINGDTTSKLYVLGATSTGNQSVYRETNVYMQDNVLYGAAWNDYAEFRKQKEIVEPGYCVASADNGQVYKTTERLQACDGIVSDTFGYAIGKTDECQTPLAVSGRVLAYCEGSKYDYHSGDTVGASADGKVTKMTRDEIKEYPDRIVGIVSEIPEYETWGEGNIKVNDRIWIKVK